MDNEELNENVDNTIEVDELNTQSTENDIGDQKSDEINLDQKKKRRDKTNSRRGIKNT